MALYRISGELKDSRADAVISLEEKLRIEEEKYERFEVKKVTIQKENNRYRASTTYNGRIQTLDEYIRDLRRLTREVRKLPAWRRQGIMAYEPEDNR